MRPTLRARSTCWHASPPTGTRVAAGRQRAGGLTDKTGGSPAETAEQLHEKHLLQATCYAYAVLMEGYAQVECVFVRVEQDRADAPGQPQTGVVSF